MTYFELLLLMSIIFMAKECANSAPQFHNINTPPINNDSRIIEKPGSINVFFDDFGTKPLDIHLEIPSNKSVEMRFITPEGGDCNINRESAMQIQLNDQLNEFCNSQHWWQNGTSSCRDQENAAGILFTQSGKKLGEHTYYQRKDCVYKGKKPVGIDMVLYHIDGCECRKIDPNCEGTNCTYMLKLTIRPPKDKKKDCPNMGLQFKHPVKLYAANSAQ